MGLLHPEGFQTTHPSQEMTMILLSALRFIHTVWVEAREMQREALKRFPHLRSE